MTGRRSRRRPCATSSQGDVRGHQSWWAPARPACAGAFSPRPVIHVRREIELDLATGLTALPGYRQARWRAVILYGMAGIGKTAVARSLTDDDQVKKAFRDGIAWVDSNAIQAEAMRLCLGFDLERQPGEQWIGCWQRWAGTAERRLLLIVDDMLSAESLPPLIAGLGQRRSWRRSRRNRAQKSEARSNAGCRRRRSPKWVYTGSGRTKESAGQAVIEHSLVDVEWDMVKRSVN